jgi:hypothetical protein
MQGYRSGRIAGVFILRRYLLFWGRGITVQNRFHGNELPVDFLTFQILMILQ